MLELNRLYNMDCRNGLKLLDDNSIDSIVTDPPYELGFMGKKWDSTGIAYNVDLWREALRVLKPGGYLLAFGGTRTYHRMTCAIEDAGFEIRDCIQWIYGSGFPKSMDISKAIDKRGGEMVGWFGKWLREWRTENNITQKEIAALFPSKTGGLTGCVANWELGLNMPTSEQFNLICKTFGLPFQNMEEAEREVVGKGISGKTAIWQEQGGMGNFDVTIPATDAAKQWQGWGTALKPANEPIVVARKPISGTVAENVLKWRTGGINIDECRLEPTGIQRVRKAGSEFGQNSGWNDHANIDTVYDGTQGRWPANVIFDEEAAEILDRQSGTLKSGDNCTRKQEGYFVEHGGLGKAGDIQTTYGDIGGASRFFYCAKASQSERNFGCEDMPDSDKHTTYGDYKGTPEHSANLNSKSKNFHPTVKPLKLIEYLITLVTPKGGICLDMFEGSGTHGVACKKLYFNFIGFELSKEYYNIAQKRMDAVMAQVSFL